MKYIVVDESGRFLAGYTPDVHGPRVIKDKRGTRPNPNTMIPPEAVEVSDEIWAEMAAHQQTRRYVGGRVETVAPPAAPPPTEGDVKAEAGRRIIEIMPEHTQRNTLALFAETVQTHGADPANWPRELRAINNQALGAWQKIKAIRARSDEIEQMDPIPADFRDDSYWPQTGGPVR